MMFDSSTVNVFLVILLVVAIWVFILWSNSRSMHKMIHRVARQQSFIRQDEAVRSLCRAIHYLQPTVHAGIDYIVSPGGPDQEPYISEWLHTSIPQPKPEEIEHGMKMISGVDPAKDHAVQRLKEYPSVGDQLDAAYKSRRGDDSDQIRLDEQITMIKKKYPKSDQAL
jgi:hypothetical protein